MHCRQCDPLDNLAELMKADTLTKIEVQGTPEQVGLSWLAKSSGWSARGPCFWEAALSAPRGSLPRRS